MEIKIIPPGSTATETLSDRYAVLLRGSLDTDLRIGWRLQWLKGDDRRDVFFEGPSSDQDWAMAAAREYFELNGMQVSAMP